VVLRTVGVRQYFTLETEGLHHRDKGPLRESPQYLDKGQARPLLGSLLALSKDKIKDREN
jgi:hypothetical protein